MDNTTTPNIKALERGPWASRGLAQTALAPVRAHLQDWADWPIARQAAWVQHIVLCVGREILPHALRAYGLDQEADRCAQAQTLADIEAAAGALASQSPDLGNIHHYDVATAVAWAAHWAQRDALLRAVWHAAMAANSAVWAVRTAPNGSAADGHALLVQACQIWARDPASFTPTA